MEKSCGGASTTATTTTATTLQTCFVDSERLSAVMTDYLLTFTLYFALSTLYFFMASMAAADPFSATANAATAANSENCLT